MSDKLSLPSSSYDEMVKIIKGYSHVKGPASLDDIAKLVGMNRTAVSANNKFLAESALITVGNKKSPTDLGGKLGRALDHNQAADVRACWKEMISGNEGIAGLVTTIRIKGGMTSEELSAHILYVSGQNNTKANRAGANALVEILKASGLVELVDGKIVIAQPIADEQTVNTENVIEAQTNVTATQAQPQPQVPHQAAEVPRTQSGYQIAAQSNPQIAINIQLHLPETDNPEVYQNLFRALKENLLTQGD